MPKRSQDELRTLQTRAKTLFEQGYGKEEIAIHLGVSLRSVQRWLKDANHGERAERDVQVPNRPTMKKLIQVANEIAPEVDQQLQKRKQQQPSDEVTPTPTNISESLVLDRIKNLMPLALSALERILQNDEISTSNLLKAVQIAADWNAYSKGLSFSLDLATEALLKAGYLVVDPTIPPESQMHPNRGLSDHAANLIREKILFGDSEVDIAKYMS